jgi:uncharacterized secreted protein with C-terminal beta-propeller domain
MRLRPLAVLVLTALLVSAAAATADGRPRAAKRLKAFSSCEALIAYASRHVPPLPVRRDLPVAPAPAPAPEAAIPVSGGAPVDDTSGTNVQESGVDEPDTVKTDGRTLFALAGGMLHAVEARATDPDMLDTLALGDGWGASLLLHDGRLFVLGGGPRGARITEVDVSNPRDLRVLRTEDFDGHIVDARLTGHTARVAISSYPEAIAGAAELRGRPSGWLPSSTLRRARSGKRVTSRAVGCRSVRRPRVFSGAGVLTVYTVDLAKGLPAVDADAIFTSAETVYASERSFYAATQRWDGEGMTSIHRFDTSDPDETRYGASGAVPGSLLNEFSLSEHDGILRAASTVGFGRDAESRVTTLDRQDGLLVQRGAVGGLGRGERIFAVRFMGDVGYVVTFRQVDPLYTIDLADPAKPRVLGELKIPGYSAYLHPVAEDLLLGVGQDATADGGLLGMQLSLFDVSDLANPARVAQLRLSDGWSQSAVEWDHHAFLWWPAAKLAVLPVDSEDFTGAAGFRVDRATGIAEVGRVRHPGNFAPSIGRAVVVGQRLLTVSEQGVRASALDTFAPAGWAPFPNPPQPPVPEPIPIDFPASSPAG